MTLSTGLSAKSIAQLIGQLGSTHFPHALIEFLGNQTDFDTALVTLYKRDFKPILLFPTDPNEISTTLKGYLKSAYVLDPLFNAINVNGTKGVVRLQQIAPDSFHSTEYYLSCYKEFDLADEINLIIELAPQTSCAITLGRRARLGSITRAELTRLNELFPIIEALVTQFWSQHATTYLQYEHSDSAMRQAISSFGKGVLTRREQEIAGLILEGNSSKSIAERLNISVGTVKVHRKNIHTKLNTSNQSEMFTLFIAHLNRFA